MPAIDSPKESTSSSEPSPEEPKSKTSSPQRAAAGEIEALTRAIVDAINRRDWDGAILTTLAWPEFHASELDVFPSTSTWVAHMETFKQIAKESPMYRMDIQELTVEVAPTFDMARVFITAEISGRPVEVKRKSLGVLSWERFPQGWRAVSHVNMRLFMQP